MQEPYIERAATDGGPGSCVGVREGAGEALTGVRAGRVIEPRDQRSRGADVVGKSRSRHRRRRCRERSSDPARSEGLGKGGGPMRENEEILCPPVPRLSSPGEGGPYRE